jgi:pyruvate dehydrogenase E2 component (dihydrolipoamide acetyltransferase)
VAEFEFRLQQLSMGMSDGVVTHWYKNEGDEVAAGDPIAEIDTGKVTQDVESPEPGTITRIVAPLDEPLDIGAVLCVIKVPD